MHADPQLNAEDRERITGRIAELYVEIRNQKSSESGDKRCVQRHSVNSEVVNELEIVSQFNCTSNLIIHADLINFIYCIIKGL